MPFLGMDVEAAARYASVLENQAANEVFNVLTSMSGIVQQLMSVWHGEDAARYDQEWAAQRANLSALHGALNDLVAALERGIADQRAASDH
jgi:uncharacterized protein YukE